MFSIEIECPPEQNDMLVAELWEEGSAGIVELEGGRLRAFSKTMRTATRCSRGFTR